MASTRVKLLLTVIAAAVIAVCFAGESRADDITYTPYCFVPIGEYKNTCDPTFLWPQTSASDGVPGTFGPDGQYTPQRNP